MQIQFGTDGWRGVIADTFTFENLSVVAQATIDYMRREDLADRGIVIGYDRRFLSHEFAERVAEIAAGNGIKVWFSDGFAPTPAVSWAVFERGAGLGIMITASHNPPRYNGFKIKEGFGGSARPATTKLLEQIVAENQAASRKIVSKPLREAMNTGEVEVIDLRVPYLAQLGRYVDLEAIRNAEIPAVVDPMFGAGCGYLPELIPGIAEIHGTENPSFGGHPPEPIAENLEALSALVATGEYKVGLALDGDADRIGAVDETGEFFSSHRIYTVLLRHLYERKGVRGGVVKTVSTTRMIDLLAEKFDLPIFETPIGFKHICELMLEHDILMGGEESGGLGVKGHIPERDGILMGLLLLEAMAMSGKGLRELLEETMDEVGHFFYNRIDLHIEKQAKEDLVAKLAAGGMSKIAGREVVKENFRDGFKFIFGDGSWLLIRPSGTEPVLRLYSEAGDMATVTELLSAARGIAGI
ncbi:phosphoglucomutase/phosphomannomutase family protein [Geomesophilobacter sediminis]|uniref:Phosphoglucomutase/phosphomannomutase family protein n=1 Tax=Geomesophilobacter sediminis TaxID=2798584 RepID=A0A8J7LWF2_9BACT|nr:phosphoglucomutase/phosphomannomutase family protein [Geomesophilobacter sediminis]MBJ6725695.1 phosphoglucomutase/phosphomannomutase family protein [Geomesophilobacter sediminis]